MVSEKKKKKSESHIFVIDDTSICKVYTTKIVLFLTSLT